MQFSNEKQFKDVYIKYIQHEKTQISVYNKKISEFHNKIKDIDRKIEELYLDKLNRIVDESIYIKMANKFVDEKNILKQEIINFEELIKNALDNSIKLIDENKLKNVINEFLNTSLISKNMIYNLINRIEIDKEKNIFINFNFKPLNILKNYDITEYNKVRSL